MYTEETGIKMPLWAKVVMIILVIISAKILYELVHGNKAILILLGCAILIIGFKLLQSWRDHEHTD